MKVTASSQTTKGVCYQLDNGDSVLMRELRTPSGKLFIEAVYQFDNGRTYSARTGLWAQKTVIPAMAAVNRFLASQ